MPTIKLNQDIPKKEVKLGKNNFNRILKALIRIQKNLTIKNIFIMNHFLFHTTDRGRYLSILLGKVSRFLSRFIFLAKVRIKISRDVWLKEKHNLKKNYSELYPDTQLFFKHTNINAAIESIGYLNEYGICTHQNIRLVLKHKYPDLVAFEFVGLSINHALTASNQEIVLAQEKPNNIHRLISVLQKENIYLSQNIGPLTSILPIFWLVASYKKLKENGLLQPQYEKVISQYSGDKNVVNILVQLKKLGLISGLFEQKYMGMNDCMAVGMALIGLYQYRSLRQYIHKILMHDFPKRAADALILLEENNACGAVQAEIVICHKNPEAMAKGVIKLQQHGLGKVFLYQYIFSHATPHKLAKAVVILKKEKLVKDHLKVMRCSPHPTKLARAYILLFRAGMRTTKRIRALSRHNNPHLVVEEVVLLHKENLLNMQIEKVIFSLENPMDIGKAFIVLKQNDLLTTHFQKMVQVHQYKILVAKALAMLKKAELLQKRNEKLICRHKVPYHAANVLIRLHQQEKFLLPYCYGIIQQSNPHLILKSLQYLPALLRKNVEIIQTIIASGIFCCRVSKLIVTLYHIGLADKISFTEQLLHRKMDRCALQKALELLMRFQLTDQDIIAIVVSAKRREQAANCALIINEYDIKNKEILAIVCSKDSIIKKKLKEKLLKKKVPISCINKLVKERCIL